MAFHKRSIYLINPNFQLRFCLFVSLIVFISSLVYPLVIYDLIDSFIVFMSEKAPALVEIDHLKEKRQSLILILSLWQIAFTALVFITCIFISHKIAGPMYKLQKFLSEKRNGIHHDRLFFRKGDYFHEVADDINETFADIDETHKNDIVYLSEVTAYIKNLSMVVPENKQSVLDEIVVKLNEIQERSKVHQD